jgi:hypothetical protein
LSAALGALLAWLFGPVAGRRDRALLFAASVPTVFTWSVEWAGLMPISNATRAVAALPLGAIAAWVIVQMLRYDAQRNARKIRNRRTGAYGV